MNNLALMKKCPGGQDKLNLPPYYIVLKFVLGRNVY